MIGRIFLAALAIALAAAPAGALPRRTGGTPVPPGALSAGYTTKTFETTNFNTSNVDTAGTYGTGFQWYLWNFFGHTVPAADATINADGSITLAGGFGNGTIASAAVTGVSPYFVGSAYSGGFYMEAEIKFDAQLVNTSTSGWPSWWAMSLEHLTGGAAASEQWPGQVPGYNHFSEVDFLEYDINPVLFPNVYGGTAHDWYGVFNTACYCDVATPSNQRATPVGTDWSIYHRVGVLAVPATAGTNGTITFYFDDEPLGTVTSYSQFTTQSPPPTLATPWTWGIIDQQHMVMILGTSDPTAPMTVKSVHVWQASAASNMTH